jgi:hypothetical protein
MDSFKRLKGEPLEALNTRIVNDRAKGRCEFTWYENHIQKRCTELHGERAQSFSGVVSLIPMPVNGLLDSRVSSLKAYCQKHAYALLEEMRKSIGCAGKKSSTASRFQVDLFGGHA